MNQFDLALVETARGRRQLVVVLQHNRLADLDTTVVAPLVPTTDLPAIKQLRPILSVDGVEYCIVIDRLATLPRRQLRPAQKSASGVEFQIRSALDLLFAGF